MDNALAVATTINVFQLLLPFILFGDLVTDIWFLVNISILLNKSLNTKQTYSDTNSNNKNLPFIVIVMLFMTILGMVSVIGKQIKKCCSQDHWLSNQKSKKIFYLLCCLGGRKFFLFLYQRMDFFGPRDRKFELQLLSITFAQKFIMFWIYAAFFFSAQILYFSCFSTGTMDLINFLFTIFVLLYHILSMCSNCCCPDDSSSGSKGVNQCCCIRICTCLQQLEQKMEEKCFPCCPKRSFQQKNSNHKLKIELPPILHKNSITNQSFNYIQTSFK